MIAVLRYGDSARLPLDLHDATLVANCDAPRGEALPDVMQAVDHALGDPLGFPPLASSVVPGDKVVLALAEPVSRAEEIIACTIRVLMRTGVEPRDIMLLLTSHAAKDDVASLLANLPADHRSQIVTRVHDPARRDSLSYLAAATDGKPIYVNRAIHDADFVISIGSLRLAGSLGYFGINSEVFPAFSDSASIERYRSPRAIGGALCERLRRDADEVGWLLGARFTIQVIPGAGSEILHVLAGDAEAVFRAGSRFCEQAWSYEVPRRADLIVATIDGGALTQTWENIGRALAAALESARPDGAVVICSDLDEPPSAAMRQLSVTDSPQQAIKLLGQHKSGDVLAAAELAKALARGKVYLISRLEDELVEDLGMLPITAADLSRLVKRYESCIILANAHHAIAHSRGERPSEKVLAKAKPRT